MKIIHKINSIRHKIIRCLDSIGSDEPYLWIEYPDGTKEAVR